MLSDADAELVRNDPDIPGLRLLLDADAFGHKVAQHWPQLVLTRIEALQVRYERGRQCLAAFRLHTERSIIRVYAKAYHRDIAPMELLEAKAKRYAAGDEGMTVRILSDFGLVIYASPNDKALSMLIHTYDPDQLYDLLRSIFPLQPTWWNGQLKTIGYSPERCLVTTLVAQNSSRAIIKFYATETYHELIDRNQSLCAITGIGLPNILGHSHEYHAIGFEWLPGMLLNKVMMREDKNSLIALRMTGKALARFHQEANGKVEQILDHDSHTSTLQQQAEQLSSLSDYLRAPANELAKILSERLHQEEVISNVIHGSFHYRHALVSKNGISILDLDTLALGDPASDLGHFIAQLERNSLRGILSPEHTKQFSLAFLKGYGETNMTRVELYTAIALFKLAANPFVYREEQWLSHTQAMIQQSRRILTKLPTRCTNSAANAF